MTDFVSQASREGRSDRLQSFIRIAFAPALAIYLLALVKAGLVTEGAFEIVLTAILVELAIAIALLASILRHPAPSVPRRVTGMIVDYGTSAVAMAMCGEYGAPFIGLFLWMAVGNGYRFGPRYLALAVVLSALCFGFVVLIEPFWGQHWVLSASLLATMIVVPTYQRALVSALITARDEAFRANAAKNWFIARTSHELRTPLNGVLGMVELLGQTRLDPVQRRYADVAAASAKNLQAMIDDVLDISAIEADRLVITNEPIAIQELVGLVTGMLGNIADRKGITLRSVIDDDVPEIVEGDSVHLRHILVNLTQNAVKFTNEGFVEIRVTRAAPKGMSRTDMIWLQFNVEDTGVGIDQDQQGRIFEAFTQADSGRDRRFGGSGLGTTIARELARRMGGDVGLTSTLGKGSTFWARLPFGVNASAREVREQTHDPDLGKRIENHRVRLGTLHAVVCDDQPTNRMVISELLNRAGHSITEVEDGETMLDTLSHGGVDVVLLDLHMPGTTGVDVLQQAVIIEAGRQRTPIIVLSADTTTEARESCLSAGALSFIVKPIALASILDAIESAVLGSQQDVNKVIEDIEADETLVPGVLEQLVEVGFDEPLMFRFANSSLDDLRRALNRLEQSGRRGDWSAVRDHAHAIKGLAGNLGARKLARLADQLERLEQSQLVARWPQPIADVEKELTEVSAILPDLIESLHRTT